MAESKLNGNCYLCGHTYSKAGFAKHILSNHSYAGADSQDCAVIKVEGADDKSYWLYVDIALTSTLQPLDSFLRDIWLECCGHLRNFYAIGIEQIGKSKKISLLPKGFTFYYDYDFGSTTTLKITVVGHSCRPRQRKAVRLLARNIPHTFICGNCGKPATSICCECRWDGKNPFLCDDCANGHEHDYAILPVTNSPRMGECAYCGEFDVYEFDSSKFEKKQDI